VKILVSGASGLVGAALVPSLASQGHNVKRLVRHTITNPREEIHWEPAEGLIDENHLEDFDAVVHLAGENIAARRWSAAQKERIASSRVKGTKLLAGALAGVMHPPKVLVSASAIGYYGNRGDEILTEEHEPGTGFLSDTSRAWEEATEAAEQKGIRVVRLRFGIVLSPAGGALAKMLLPFKMGVGGKVGNGRQYMSWIALDDVVGAIQHAITNEDIMGPVNVVAPKAATNAEFTKALGWALSRPTIFPMPAFAARLAFGEMGDELLLGSTRVEPRKLLSSGYTFQYPELDGALRHLLGK
jgi:uncharacterized protein (TIGR01777 family)